MTVTPELRAPGTSTVCPYCQYHGHNAPSQSATIWKLLSLILFTTILVSSLLQKDCSCEQKEVSDTQPEARQPAMQPYSQPLPLMVPSPPQQIQPVQNNGPMRMKTFAEK